MYIGIPQFIYLILSIIGLGVELSKDGKPKEGNHSFWISLFATAVVYSLLFYGGFFTH